MQLWKLGCRWGSKTPVFYDYIVANNIVIGSIDKDYQVGDWLLITDGYTVLSFAKIINTRTSVLQKPIFAKEFAFYQIPFNNTIFFYDVEYINLKREDWFTYPLQQGIVKVQGQKYINTFDKLKCKYLNELKMLQITNLIKYKKQIILQGPPGTGKTRKAKEIARELLLPKEITVTEIKAIIKIGITIFSATDNKKYTVENISKTNVTLKLASDSKQTPSFQKIIEAYKNQKWNGGMTGGDAYEAAIAKHIYENILPKEQFKLIQFHPSYSYEDFVRGITAKPSENGEGIMYETENKLLGKFAFDAYKNFTESNDKQSEITETSFEKKLEIFIENVHEELDKSGSFKIADDTNARIVGVVNDGLIYSFKTREEIKYKLLFRDLIKINKAPKQINKPTDLKIIERGYLEMNGKYPYYFKVYNLIKKITLGESDNERKTCNSKNYVLIIDEINRANLSSVLGELIYALEYRGEEVESMYAVKGNNKLILPPNLYIIGTMNTADRSVGNIDYAIRRRFAFVDVPPEDLSPTLKDKFNKVLFDKVTALFDHDTYLSKEFEDKDVQLGHSYFIDKTDDGATMQMRLDYEIKPILREYVKDGVLIGEDIKKIIEDLNA